jgi:predicted dehydrogenase
MSKVVLRDRKELAEFRGGIMFELGCHIIDQVLGVLGPPDRVHALARATGKYNDGLMDNTLAVFEYPRATATVKSSAVEVDGGSRRHFVVCGTAGTFHIQPLDSPAVRLTLDRDRGEYKKGTQISSCRTRGSRRCRRHGADHPRGKRGRLRVRSRSGSAENGPPRQRNAHGVTSPRRNQDSAIRHTLCEI